MESEEVLQSGRLISQEKWLSLSCGPLAASFDPATASLRHLHVAGREVLRGIYVAVRDCNWNTIQPVLTNLHLHRSDSCFTLTFDAACQEREIDFIWHGEISGDHAGTLSFAMTGSARTAFLRNRIGFCILHPVLECAGRPCLVEKTDGKTEAGAFPRRIAPHQPFLNIRSISHEVMPGLRAEIRCEGDTFEMEDQRNWTDASFKTYCTPLALPYPVEIKAGTPLSQSVTVTLQGRTKSRARRAADNRVVVSLKGASQSRKLPHIGLGMASDGHPLTEKEIQRLRSLNLAHIRVDVRLSSTEKSENAWLDRLWRAHAEVVSRIGTKIECAVHLTGTDEAANRADMINLWNLALSKMKGEVSRVLIFHEEEKCTGTQWLVLARGLLAGNRSAFPIFGGTDAYFAELNRQPPSIEALQGVCWSINPQVHAFDNSTLIENIEGQASTVRSARALFGRKRIAISPVTLKPRFNANATAIIQTSTSQLPDSVDTRQMSLFGAGWTLASLKTLAESGASSVTYYETVGWRGVMEREQGSPLPEKFPSIPGSVFPLYHVLADVGEFAAGGVIPCVSSIPRAVEVMALIKGEQMRLLSANLTDTEQWIRLDMPGSIRSARMRLLTSSNVRRAMQSPETFRCQPGETLSSTDGVLEYALPPHAYARLDFDRERAELPGKVTR